MNGNIDFSKIVSLLKPLAHLGGYLVVLGVLGVFGYTGWVINQSFKPAATATDASGTGKVIFDKATIDKIKGLDQVYVSSNGSYLGAIATSPFGN
jgi:hypothetical protein